MNDLTVQKRKLPAQIAAANRALEEVKVPEEVIEIEARLDVSRPTCATPASTALSNPPGE